ncbi:hypothetical protein JT358_11605 [Micrococcales bacterium 31B]|nr:hypothetical protein [Micrococcales bacterium 31B]
MNPHLLRYMLHTAIDDANGGSGDKTKDEAPDDANGTGDGTGTDEDTNAGAKDAGEDDHVDGEDALGDPGKKALDAMKTKWRTERQARASLKAEVEQLKADLAKANGTDEATLAAQATTQAAMAKVNQRLVRAEARAAAKGRVVDVDTALALIDLSAIEVTDDGVVDVDAINDAIDSLLESKKFLAAQGGTARFQGDAGAGKRNAGTGKPQLTKADLTTMSSSAIEEARKEGRLNKLLGIA